MFPNDPTIKGFLIFRNIKNKYYTNTVYFRTFLNTRYDVISYPASMM